jgi:hypothetical protein
MENPKVFYDDWNLPLIRRSCPSPVPVLRSPDSGKSVLVPFRLKIYK